MYFQCQVSDDVHMFNVLRLMCLMFNVLRRIDFARMSRNQSHFVLSPCIS